MALAVSAPRTICAHTLGLSTGWRWSVHRCVCCAGGDRVGLQAAGGTGTPTLALSPGLA